MNNIKTFEDFVIDRKSKVEENSNEINENLFIEKSSKKSTI